MKRAVFVNLLIVGLVFTLSGPGCKKPQKGVTNIPAAKGGQVSGPDRTGPRQPSGPDRGPVIPPDTTPRGDAVSSTPIPEPTKSGFEQPNIDEIEGMIPDTNHFAAQTIYFEFDSSVVRTSQHGRANAVGDELKAKADCRLMIDGHCDERGTEEYNRALGERRALAVREYLIRYGISPARISTRSWGEDRPADPGHNEEAWSKNRRAEFILLQPKPQ